MENCEFFFAFSWQMGNGVISASARNNQFHKNKRRRGAREAFSNTMSIEYVRHNGHHPSVGLAANQNVAKGMVNGWNDDE